MLLFQLFNPHKKLTRMNMNGINSFAIASAMSSMGGMGYGHYHSGQCHRGITGVELVGAIMTANMKKVITMPSVKSKEDVEEKERKEAAGKGARGWFHWLQPSGLRRSPAETSYQAMKK